MKQKLLQIGSTLDSLWDDLTFLKDSIERGESPFSEQGYFNLLVIRERIKEAKERLDTITKNLPPLP